MPRCGPISACQRLGAFKGPLRSPFACTRRDLPLPRPLKGMILASKPPGIWRMSANVPVGYRPSWQEVIGDACIVTEPKHSPAEPVKYYSEPLIKAVEPHLAIAFIVVYEDELWKIWKRSGGCDATGGQS
jgi:hypothetical protein